MSGEGGISDSDGIDDDDGEMDDDVLHHECPALGTSGLWQR